MSAARHVLHAGLVTLAALAGCKQDLLDDLPDAASLDATDIPTPPGDFSCVGAPYPTTAADPLNVRGRVYTANAGRGGVVVEVHDADTDTLLFQDVTDNTTPDRAGKYSSNVVTGGVAPRLYRKALGGSGHLDVYAYDGIPVSLSYELGAASPTDATTTAFYSEAGVARDLTKGSMAVDVIDCSLPPVGPTATVPGAVVEAPPGATVVYITPERTLDPALTATTAAGTFMVFNVTPGVVDLEIQAGPIRYRSWPVRVYPNSWTSGPRHP